MKTWGVAVVAICLLGCQTHAEEAAPWRVPYGAEPWRARATGVDLGDVVERVACAIGRDGSMHTPTYAAVFDGQGLRFTAGADATLALRTTRVNGREVAGAATWSILGNTAQVQRAPGVIEHHETRDAGVEVTWIVRERAAPLVVEIAVEGLAYLGQSESGLHFGTAGTARVRLGAAELVDARGRRWSVPAVVDGMHVRWQVDARVLAEAAFPVALDPLVSAELGTDHPVLVGAAGAQTSPQVASDGTDYLVVWADGRAGIHDSTDVYAARVSHDGVLLDPSGILIASDVGLGGEPQVAWNNSHYLVVGARQGLDSSYSHAIVATRITSTGTIVDPAGIVIRPGEMFGTQHFRPVVASNGTDWLVAWSETGRRVVAGRVSAGGEALDGAGTLIARTSNTPSIASNGTDYFMSWVDDNTVSSPIYGTRVSISGTPQTEGGILLRSASHGRAPRVASNGLGYLVVWNEGDAFGQLVSDAGTPVGGTLTISAAADSQENTAVASNGTDYLVAWEDRRVAGHLNIYGTRVGASGTVVDPAGLLLGEDVYPQRNVAVASNGSDYFLAWEGFRTSITDIFGTRVSADGVALDVPNPLVSPGPSTQRTPDVASNGTDFLVVWADFRSESSWDVYATRLSAAGAILDPDGIAVSTRAAAQEHPVAASNGTDFLVAWSDYRDHPDGDLVGARIGAAGQVLDPDGFLIANVPQGFNGFSGLAVASNGQDYLTVWNSLGENHIYAARVLADGAAPDPTGIPMGPQSGTQQGVAVASNGETYLVVWADLNVPTSAAIWGTRVGANGGVLDGSGLPITHPPQAHVEPAVASNGTDYLVVSRSFVSSDDTNVYATRFAADGTILDAVPFEISTAAHGQSLPTVASDGVDYFVAWDDQRTFDDLVYGSRVSSAGAPLDSEGVFIASVQYFGGQPRLAHAAEAYLVTYRDGFRVGARLIQRDCSDPGEACPDAGVPDAGAPDASVVDAAPELPADASAADATPTATPDAGSDDEPSGCGCQVAARRGHLPGGLLGLGLGLLALCLGARRRRA
jgi:hypothetical protein